LFEGFDLSHDERDDIDVNFLWLNRAKKEEDNVMRKSVKF
jgi:hypothetical protein